VVAAIVNPAAGRGKARRRLDEIQSCFASHGISRIELTTKSGDEERLARQLIDDGASTIVAVGGDGTCGRIANAIVRASSNCALAVVPAGTGNDFAKTLGVAKPGVAETIALAATGPPIRIDVGRADGRCFVNSCGFGFDASVLEATTQIHWLRGNAVYIYSALRMLFGYRGLQVTGVPPSSGGATRHLLMLTVSNGRFLGGAFMIAPRANVGDGLLDVCYVNDMSVRRRLQLFARAMRGTHSELAGVSLTQESSLTLRFDSPPLMEVDGELRRAGSSEVTIKCVPRALSVVAAPGAIAL